MSNDFQEQRRARVRLEILRTLDRVSGNALEEPIAFADTNLHLPQRAELSEFRKELDVLISMGLVTTVAPLIGGPRLIRATTAGLAEVAANQ